MIYGRAAERAALDRLLDDATRGRSSALVISGEAGTGKSTMLQYAGDRGAALGLPVRWGSGIETEAELPYAALHLILSPHLAHLDALPPQQAGALRAALGQAEQPAGDRFLVGVGVLTLLSELAGDGPLLMLVDDAHWIDQGSAGALLFAARRLEAEGIVMLFTVRDGHRTFLDAGLPELRLGGLDPADAMALLSAHSPDLAPPVRERVLAEADGNPLALLELPAALTPEQRAGWAPVGAGGVPTGSVPGADRVRQALLAQIRALPEPGQTLLLVAAADDTGDLATVVTALERLGIQFDQLLSAGDGGLIRIADGRVGFRHPLIRSVVYHDAPVPRRLMVHRALAGALRNDADADRRAWHLAAGAAGPDETVAAALERSAEHARARGGYGAVAAAYQRAAGLSPDPAQAVRRLAAAARAAATAGQPDRATALAQQATQRATDPLVLAELAWVRTTLSHEQDQPADVTALAEAATAVAAHDPDTAATMLVDAVTASWAADDPAAARSVTQAVARLQAVPAGSLLARTRAVVEQLAGGEPRAALPQLWELLDGLGTGPGRSLWERVGVRWWYELFAGAPQAQRVAAELVRDCRAQGAIGLLPRALLYLARALVRLGRYPDACVAGGEGLRIAEDTNQPHFATHLRGVLAGIAAIEGEVERFRGLADGILAHGLTEKGVECLHASNLLDLGLGRPEAVTARWDRLAVGAARDLALRQIATLPDYVEAAVRTGAPQRAAEPAGRLEAWAEATGAPWVEAVALRCRALLATGDSADELFQRAGKLHAEDGQPLDRARTDLLYGEWLRRRRQRNAARRRLRAALETFQLLGAAPWVARARTELRAAGEAVGTGQPQVHLLGRLTPQELQVVRLAASGLSNREIGAQLFLSPRTVGYHLYKAYPKLGVASRADLHRIDLS